MACMLPSGYDIITDMTQSQHIKVFKLQVSFCLTNSDIKMNSCRTVASAGCWQGYLKLDFELGNFLVPEGHFLFCFLLHHQLLLLLSTFQVIATAVLLRCLKIYQVGPRQYLRKVLNALSLFLSVACKRFPSLLAELVRGGIAIAQENMEPQQHGHKKQPQHAQQAQDDVDNQQIQVSLFVLCVANKGQDDDCQCQQQHAGQKDQVAEKVLIIALADAAADPWTMVVEPLHAHVAVVAVRGPRRPVDVAHIAELELIGVSFGDCSEHKGLILADGVVQVVMADGDLLPVPEFKSAEYLGYDAGVSHRQQPHHHIHECVEQQGGDGEVPVAAATGRVVDQNHGQVDDDQGAHELEGFRHQTAVLDLVLEIGYFGQLVHRLQVDLGVGLALVLRVIIIVH